MEKFDDLLKKYNSLVLEADETDAISQDPEMADVENTSDNQETDVEQPIDNGQNVKQLTVEGKRYLIELIQKALSVDPDNLTAEQKAIFDEEITVENADDMLNQLTALIEPF